MNRRVRLGCCCAAAIAASFVACKPKTPQAGAKLRPLNVVVVTVDTLRASRLHCYGNDKIETPTFDRLAQKGVLFESAVAQTPLTPPSHASIFTGLYPNVHQVRNTGGFALQPSSVTLATLLQKQGWDTAAFIGASVLKKTFGLNQGFTVYDDQMPKAEESREEREYPERKAGIVVDHALAWLNAQSGKPFLLWVHLYDPHMPWEPPSPFREKYKNDLYDGEVAYTDQQLGRLLDGVAKKSPADKTLVVVLADHGESLGDHGEFSHGVFLYDATVRIPFLMNGPGVPAGLRVKHQARTVDVLPTVMDLLGGKAPAAAQGVSLVPAFSGKDPGATYSYEETLYSKINMGWAELRGIRTARWKYIRAPKPELYDLAQDPGEKTNVIESHPKEFRELESQLKTLSRTGKGDTEKVTANVMDKQSMEQLKSLGYLSGVAGREFELTGKGADPKDRLASLEALQLSMGPGSEKTPPARKIALLRGALGTDPENPSLYYQLGAEYEKGGRYEQAMGVYTEAQQKGVRNGKLLSRMGDLYLRSGRKDEAIGAYEQAAQFNPSDYESQTNLATAYLEKGRVEDAERVFRWVLTVDQYAPAYNGLGLIAIQRRNIPEARTHFEQAVALDPELIEAQLNLGIIYKMAGDIPRARTCFEAFLAKATRARYGEVIPKVKDELASMR
ncbi:MAG: sulfatase-like hydrolase/transferase [Acidobacteriota bacterium]